ncbi:MAG TPA: di-trans,poly-cis-decaprenylcistransferase [Gemmatimonadetes bacterium]|nr:di-trans,poly-cis-decaprenylcistransferase [Gemmatimonadota bacterium]|tara:strand:- start:5122 stop:5865 length:744 start_codon:yes stop_codon:yes gene_type:complete
MASDLLHQIRLHGAIPRHIAIIMDGNGRWARGKGLPRTAGHRQGMNAVREVIEGAVEAGIEILTLFAFSTDNWQRPRVEISALMGLLTVYARQERAELVRQGVEVHVLGELDRMDAAARRAVDTIVDGTSGGSRMRLNLMISYGAREEIVRATRLLAERVAKGELDPSAIDDDAFRAELFTGDQPDPDLLIRTSGEFRLSNFLLWQLAYTELHVTPVLWPDFSRKELFSAVRDFQRRERRFGRVRAG